MVSNSHLKWSWKRVIAAASLFQSLKLPFSPYVGVNVSAALSARSAGSAVVGTAAGIVTLMEELSGLNAHWSATSAKRTPATR